MGRKLPMRMWLGVALCLWTASAARNAQATTWVVSPPDDPSTAVIQAAADQAASGDTIQIEPGTYYENLLIQSKRLNLVGPAGAAVTIVDGSTREGAVIALRHPAAGGTSITGLTLTGGTGYPRTSASTAGGGLFADQTWFYMKDCIIQDNTVSGVSPWGGGIAIGGDSSQPTSMIAGTSIRGNSSTRNAGGLFVQAPCRIENCLIEGNDTMEGDGGGVYLFGGRLVEFLGCVVRENSSADHGGGIFVNNDNPLSGADAVQIIGNSIIANQSHTQGAGDPSGGGVMVVGSATLLNNTIAFNTAISSPAPPAGGIGIEYPNDASVVERNVIYHNSGGGMVVGRSTAFDQLPATIQQNLLSGNDPEDLIDLRGGAGMQLDGNIFSDPLFCEDSAEGNGEVASNSPALTQPFGVIGAYSSSGCGPIVPTRQTSWGRIKQMY